MLEQLANIVGKENLLDSESSRFGASIWPHFSTTKPEKYFPLAVAQPPNLESAAQLISFCATQNIKILTRGGGTFPELSLPPDEEGRYIILSSHSLKRVLQLDKENMRVKVQAGVTLVELSTQLRQHKLFFPPDPLNPIATMGGLVAANASGPRSQKYGPVSNWVGEMEAILANGQRIHCFSQTDQPANIAHASPLTSLLCGSMGSLAFIGSVSLRLRPMPGARQTLLAVFENYYEAATPIGDLSLLGPEIMELMPEGALQGKSEDKAALLLAFVGEPECAQSQCASAQKLLAQAGAAYIRKLSETEFAEIMAKFRGILPALRARGPFYMQGLAAPVSELPTLIRELHIICSNFSANFIIFGHCGLAHLRVAIFGLKNDAQALALRNELFKLQLILNQQLHSTDESDFSLDQWRNRNSSTFALEKQIKLCFDPQNLWLAPRMESCVAGFNS